MLLTGHGFSSLHLFDSRKKLLRTTPAHDLRPCYVAKQLYDHLKMIEWGELSRVAWVCHTYSFNGAYRSRQRKRFKVLQSSIVLLYTVVLLSFVLPSVFDGSHL
jgi:preprotein translocase subunit Sec63